MQVARYIGQGRLDLVGAEPIPPPPGTVQLSVAYTGICGTDLHIVHGAMDGRVERPAILGHEMAGEVAAVGSGVDGWQPGDRATVMPLVACGGCYACTSGAGHICYQLSFLGIDSPGSMQERWNVPAEVLVRLPPSLSLRIGALAEPAAVAVHDVRRARLAAGEHAVVLGAGPIGLLVASVARAAGGEIAVAEPNVLRRTVAEELGFRAVDPVAERVEAWVEDWTRGAGAQVAFEVSGTEAGLAAAVGSLGARGRCVAVGIQATPPRVDVFRLFWRELELIGARVYERCDFEEAVRLLADGDLPTDALITDVRPLEEVEAAFRSLEAGRALKILLACSGEHR